MKYTCGASTKFTTLYLGVSDVRMHLHNSDWSCMIENQSVARAMLVHTAEENSLGPWMMCSPF